MQIHDFKGHLNPSLYLNRHKTSLATGDVKCRVKILNEMDEAYADQNLQFGISGCLDATETIPNGQTVKSSGYPYYNCHTEPGYVTR